MHNRFNKLKLKLANIGSLFLLTILPLSSPKELLDPNKLSALFLIPMSLLCFIFLCEFINKITTRELILSRRFLRLLVVKVSFKRSNASLNLISLSYILMLIHQHFAQNEYIFIGLSFVTFITSIIIFANENSKILFPNHQFIFNLLFTVVSATSVYISSIYAGNQVNAFFSVSADAFPNTTKILIFYNIARVVLPTIAILILLCLLMDTEIELNLIPEKRKLFFIAIAMLFFGMSMNIESKIKETIENTAMFSDFNNNNKCLNKELKRDTPVVFLDQNMHLVLVALQQKDHKQYEILRCQ